MSNLEAARAKIQEARAIQESERSERLAAYVKLVNDSVQGNEVDPDDVLATIEAAGMTFADFERHVGNEQHRIECEQRVATRPDLKQRIAKLQEEAAAREQEARDMLQKHAKANQEAAVTHESQRREHQSILDAESWLARYKGIELPEHMRAPAEIIIE